MQGVTPDLFSSLTDEQREQAADLEILEVRLRGLTELSQRWTRLEFTRLEDRIWAYTPEDA